MSPWKYPNIEGERAKRDWSKEYLAKRLGISSRTYRNWITDGRIPSDKLKKLSLLFNCSTDYLLEETDDAA